VSATAPTKVAIYCANNIRVGDQILINGLSRVTGLNGQVLTVAAKAGTGATVTAYDPNPNRIIVSPAGTIPAGLTGLINETGVVTRLTPGPSQPSLFFTDPAQYNPPEDGGPFITTKSVMSVEHPGRAIPDVITGSVTRVERMTLTTAQLLALNTHSVQILPEPEFMPSGLQGSPGRRLAYSIKWMHFRLNFGGTAFAGSGAVRVGMGPVANNIFMYTLPAAFLHNTQDFLVLNEVASGSTAGGGGDDSVGPDPAGLIENQPVILSSQAAITAGNGTLTVILEFTVVQT
jgi:hypothetical protein